MASSTALQPWLLLIVLLPVVASQGPAPAPVFDENYVGAWGADGYHLVNQGTEVRLTLDRSNGAGFCSKLKYASGFFHMRMKIPAGYTAGVVTTFYLQSESATGDNDEVDIEFFGDKDGKPITLQTNFFVNGHGQREQRFHLWFDPAADFHVYKILWNQYQLVMFVDDTPIRVLKNMTCSVPGYEFPAKEMLVHASLWDGSDWATDGGRTKVDYNRTPFTAAYQGFDVDACANTSSTPCDSPDLWWNAGGYMSLTADQQAAYENVKKTYMNYDYCADKDRFKNDQKPAECSYT